MPPEVVPPWTLRAAAVLVSVEALLEGTTAIAATEVATGARLALGGVALTVLVLLSSSLHAFPSPTLPKG